MRTRARLAEDKPLVDAIMARLHLSRSSRALAAVFANFPNPVLRWAMRVLVFPLGRHAKPASDRGELRFARAVLRPGAFRDRLTTGTYVSMDPKDVTGVLEDALIKVTKAEEIEAKFVRAHQEGDHRAAARPRCDHRCGGGGRARRGARRRSLRLADEATDRVIKVDDFEFDELAAKQLSRARSDRSGSAADRGLARSKRTAAMPQPQMPADDHTGASRSISKGSAG